MSKALMAVAAVFAAAVSAQAGAVTTVAVPIEFNGTDGAFSSVVAGEFSRAYTFSTTDDGLVSASFTYTVAGTNPGISFTTFELNGETLAVSLKDGALFFSIDDLFSAAGTQTLLIAGSGRGGFGGSVSFQPADGGGNPNPTVPEPATWAMMALGFGLVGAGLRRRRVRTVAA